MEIPNADNLGEFFDLCCGKEVNLTISQALNVLKTARNWESQDVMRSVLNMVLTNADIETLAVNFEFLCEIPVLSSCDPLKIYEITEQANCSQPDPKRFCKIVLEAVQANGHRAVSLIDKMDLLNAEEETLDALRNELISLGIEDMFPDIQRVIELKKLARKYDGLVEKEREMRQARDKAVQRLKNEEAFGRNLVTYLDKLEKENVMLLNSLNELEAKLEEGKKI